MTVVKESQKIIDINPWDFEPDFYPAVGEFAVITMLLAFQLGILYHITVYTRQPPKIRRKKSARRIRRRKIDGVLE